MTHIYYKHEEVLIEAVFYNYIQAEIDLARIQ